MRAPGAVNVQCLTWVATWGTRRRSLAELSLRHVHCMTYTLWLMEKERKCGRVQVRMALGAPTVSLQPAELLEILYPSGFAVFLD